MRRAVLVALIMGLTMCAAQGEVRPLIRWFFARSDEIVAPPGTHWARVRLGKPPQPVYSRSAKFVFIQCDDLEFPDEKGSTSPTRGRYGLKLPDGFRKGPQDDEDIDYTALFEIKTGTVYFVLLDATGSIQAEYHGSNSLSQ